MDPKITAMSHQVPQAATLAEARLKPSGEEPLSASPATAPTRLAAAVTLPSELQSSSSFGEPEPHTTKVLTRPMSNSFNDPLQKALEILDNHREQAGVDYDDDDDLESESRGQVPLESVEECEECESPIRKD